MNHVILHGNLVRDPELRNVGSGDRATQVANFTVAVNRHFKRADGSKDKETTFVDCEAWDTGAKNLAKFCFQGDPILVEGALKLDTWETDGQKRSKLKVRVKNFQRLYRAPARDETEAAATTNNSEVQAEAGTGEEKDDIPF